MTTRKLLVFLAYVAVVVQLATYAASDIGWMTKGSLYWALLYSSSTVLVSVVVWLAVNKALRNRSGPL